MQKMKGALEKILSLVLCSTFVVSSISSIKSADFSAVTTDYYPVNGYNIPIFSHGLSATGVTPEKEFPGAMELPAVGMTNTYDVSSNMGWTLMDFKEDAVMKSFAAHKNYDTRYEISDQTVISYLWPHMQYDRSTIVNIVGGNQASSLYDTRMDILKGFIATDPLKFGPAIMKTTANGMSSEQTRYYNTIASKQPEGIEPDLMISYDAREPIVNDKNDYYLYGPVYFHSHAILERSKGCELRYQISCEEIPGGQNTNIPRPTLTRIDGQEVRPDGIELNTEYYVKVPKALGRCNVTLTASGKFLKPSITILKSADGHNYWVAPIWRYDDVENKMTMRNIGKSVTLRIHRLDTSNNYVRGDSEVSIRLPNGNLKNVKLTNGYIEIPDMPLGSDYVFTEVKAPDGYATADNVKMNISDDGAIFNVYMQAPKYFVTQKFVVLSDTHEFLSGVRIDVYKDGVLFDSRWTDEKGVAEFRLPYGDYVYRQATAVDGYTPDYTEHTFEIKDQTIRKNIEIINKVVKGSITVVTLDTQSEKPIYGAKYQLHKVETDGTLTFIAEFDASAHTENMFRNIPYGNYVVSQITPPTDYRETAAKQSVSIRTDNINQTLVFRNTIHSAEVTVAVKDDKGVAVPGASISLFTIKQGVARELYKLTTDVNGEVSVTTLDVGQYKIRLNSVDPKYTIGSTSDSVEKTITLTPSHNRERVEFGVTGTLGTIQVEVYDNASNKLVPGAKYEIRNDKTGFYRTFSTNGNEPVILKDVPYGEYTIKQLEPQTGYYPDFTEYKVRIEYNGHRALQVIYLGKYTGSVKVVCKDDFGKPVVGAVFEILKDGTEESVSSPKTTNSAGEAVFSGLENGTYTVLQKSAPSGWYKSNLTGKGYILKIGDMSIVEMLNQRVKGTVTVHKVDSVSKTPIEGAILGIFDHETDMLYKYATSDKSGKAVFQDIPAGEWYIWEIKPAFGYVHNTKILGDVPNCQHTHVPTGYTDILHSSTLPKRDSNGKAPTLLNTLTSPLSFKAFTIDGSNQDITIDGNGNVVVKPNEQKPEGNQPPTPDGSQPPTPPIVSPGTPIQPPTVPPDKPNKPVVPPTKPDNNGPIISQGDKIRANLSVAVTLDGRQSDGIEVQVLGPNGVVTKTTINGAAMFEDLTVGNYTVSLKNTIPGFSVPSAQVVNISENGITQYATLSCQSIKSSSIFVALESRDGKADLKDVTLTLYRDDKKTKVETRKTDNKGTASFENIAGGTYYLHVNADAIDKYKLLDSVFTQVLLGEADNKKVTLTFTNKEANNTNNELASRDIQHIDTGNHNNNNNIPSDFGPTDTSNTTNDNTVQPNDKKPEYIPEPPTIQHVDTITGSNSDVTTTPGSNTVTLPKTGDPFQKNSLATVVLNLSALGLCLIFFRKAWQK